VAVNAMLNLTNGNIRMVQGLSRHVDPRTLMEYDDARRDDAGTLASSSATTSVLDRLYAVDRCG
jgi:hypothetical protein